jgi:hypothetical protein
MQVQGEGCQRRGGAALVVENMGRKALAHDK